MRKLPIALFGLSALLFTTLIAAYFEQKLAESLSWGAGAMTITVVALAVMFPTKR